MGHLEFHGTREEWFGTLDGFSDTPCLLNALLNGEISDDACRETQNCRDCAHMRVRFVEKKAEQPQQWRIEERDDCYRIYIEGSVSKTIKYGVLEGNNFYEEILFTRTRDKAEIIAQRITQLFEELRN